MPTLQPIHTRAERLAKRLVARDNGCLEWRGATTSKGYGVIRGDDGAMYTHRLAWELANGPIPDGLFILHHCDNPPCCNITHLFAGTNADNVADMIAKKRHHNQRRTECRYGHKFTDENTLILASGSRRCRTCHAADRARGIVATRLRRQKAKTKKELS